MINRLEAIQNRYNEISNELSSPQVVSDIKKMTELSRREERVKNTEMLVDSMNAIEQYERAYIPNASEQVKTIPEKRILGKIVEPEQKLMPTEVWESQKAYGNMQMERQRVEAIKRKQDKLIQNAIEKTLSEQDKELAEENMRLKEQNEKQEFQIRRMNQEYEKNNKELQKLVYILERIVEFIKDHGLQYAFEEFIYTIKKEFRGIDRSR